MTQIFFARHGETAWNAVRRVQGWTDIPLSPRGEAQAEALGQRMAGIPLTAVYSSDLGRAVQTATPAAKAHGLTVQPLPGLREKGFGDWEGLTAEDLERDYPAEWHRYHKQRVLEAHVPGGEQWPAVQERVDAALAQVLAAHPGPQDSVLLVGHGGSGRLLILKALQAPLPTLLNLHLENASFSHLDFSAHTDLETPSKSRVMVLNDTSHLSGLDEAAR